MNANFDDIESKAKQTDEERAQALSAAAAAAAAHPAGEAAHVHKEASVTRNLSALSEVAAPAYAVLTSTDQSSPI